MQMWNFSSKMELFGGRDSVKYGNKGLNTAKDREIKKEREIKYTLLHAVYFISRSFAVFPHRRRRHFSTRNSRGAVSFPHLCGLRPQSNFRRKHNL